ILRGYVLREELRDYPAHLHIDILPEGQGRGMGRKLMEAFMTTLRKKNIPALHLEVGLSNSGAIAFYRRMGFSTIAEYEKSLALGIKL
ncbi:MAG TPA: GNAT family N-acetyltransferase, partial [Caldithrix abyssi]|nr:GNAT family N-acetyltransferase [Caldithrix abyssi]